MLKVGLRLHAAAGQENVSGADCRRTPKGCFDVKVIIFFQKGAFNEAENIILVVIPVFVHQLGGHTFQLIGQSLFPGNRKAPLQGRRHSVLMLLPVLPKVRAAGVFSAAGVGHIKYISQLGIVPAGVNQSDSPGAAAHIPAHSIVPQVIFRAGRRLRALGKDHQLFVVGVLIQPRSGGQKGRPLLVAAGDLLRRLVRHLRVELQFSRHPCPPRQSPGTNPKFQKPRRSSVPAWKWCCPSG